ncbi:MAG: N-acetylmuramoyl-L-alanine amidase [Oscillospiraceae bacterium]|nr:N-acetylmuramoyl-L-alanine amidase [Oscillospiraceae bacterium]
MVRSGFTRICRTSIVFALILALLPLCPAARAVRCADVDEGEWYAAAVEEITSLGIMDVDENGCFRPEESASRAIIVEALWRAEGRPAASGQAQLKDVPAGSASVDWAYEAGVVAGDENRLFHGDSPVTRQELAAMLWRLEGRSAHRRALNYADNADVSDYAADAAAWCRENGLFGGVGENRFDPQGLVTRAQTAAVLCRLLHLDGAEPPPLTGCVICVDPGHCVTPLAGKGYRDPVSPLSNETKATYTTGTQGKNLTEEKLNLIVGLKLRDALRELGATVIMTREASEITINGVERCTLPNRLRADVAVRIHADGNNDRSVHGVCVMTPDGDLLGTPSIKDESVRLGRLMVNAVAKSTGAKNRGIMPRSDLTSFNFSEIPTVLIEMGFMTNAEEDALLETDEYQNKIVEGMVESLLEWYGVK